MLSVLLFCVLRGAGQCAPRHAFHYPVMCAGSCRAQGFDLTIVVLVVDDFRYLFELSFPLFRK